MPGSLRVRLFIALVALPCLVAAALTSLAIQRFRTDKELYVHDLSAQTVELVARNVAAQLEALRLRARLAAGPQAAAAPPPAAAPLLEAELGPAAPGPPGMTVQNVSSPEEARLRVVVRGPQGVLRYEIRPEALLDLRGDEGPLTLALLDERGGVLAHPQGEQVRERRSARALVDGLGLFRPGAPRLGTREVELADGPWLVAFARIDRVATTAARGQPEQQVRGLAVVQSIRKATVFAAATPLVTSAVITSVIVAAVAVVLALIIGGSVVRPVRAMTRQVEAIARGELGAAVQTSAGGALGQLAERLNAMSAALKQRNGEVALMQRQVLRAERANTAGRMIAAVAKELGEPLDICVNLASQCQRMSPGDPELRSHQLRIAQEANRAADILQNLCRVEPPAERTAAGQRPTRPVEIDMIVSDVIVSSGALLRQRNLEVEAELDTTGQVLASPDELRDLLLDVLLFVADAARPGEPLRVALRRADERELAVDVEFVGPPWTDEQRRQLVNPYDSACHGDGSLMLALSAMVLEEQGGRLEVDQADGRNRIRAILPLVS